ncbi:MAG TPA: ABC transporter permease [Pyrinomonadaceae bacterium]|nr:ABC transporter permease [Pyrinomonadaceae bacterium]
METLIQDLRYGFRSLLKSKGFTFVAVLALALGIGANSAIFSVVNSVLLRPLPFERPEELVAVQGRNERDGSLFTEHSYPNYVDLRDQSQSFAHVVAYSPTTAFITGGEEPERVRGVIASADLFPMLGVQPVLGRVYTREEDKPGVQRTIVLSYGLWQRRYGADPKIVGQEIPLGSTPAVVLGVMPQGFKYPLGGNDNYEFWMPLANAMSQSDLTGRGSVFLPIAARLKQGVRVEQAQAEANTIAARLAMQYPATNTGQGYALKALHENLVGDLRPALLVLLAAVGCVLLIACANVANLLLARAAARHKEISIRTALGASRWRIIRQLLTESLLLALMGGALGLLIAMWGIDLLLAATPADLPRLNEVTLDGRVIAFNAAMTLLTGIVFGLAPALQASKADLNEALKDGGRVSGEGGRRSKLRGALVVAEVAISLVLLVGAGLLVQSFMRLLNVTPGFDAERVMTLDLVAGRRKYPDSAQQTALIQNLLQRTSALPGVEAVGVVNPLPLNGNFDAYNFAFPGRAAFAPGEEPNADRRIISPDYFRAMSIALQRGRAFSDRDARDAPPVCTINETFARRYFADTDPVGQRIAFTDAPDAPAREVVGVVADVRHAGLDAPAGLEYYVPYSQAAFGRLTLVTRTASQDPASIMPALRSLIREIDKDLPLWNVRTMNTLMSESVARRRFNMILLGIFALVALLLASLGIYGVMSYTVTQRTHEIGIRLALGAQPPDVLKMVLKQGMLLAAAGVALGLVCSFALTRSMSSLLYGVSATDPATFGLITLLLVLVAFAANYIPARRATRVDPLTALRYE